MAIQKGDQYAIPFTIKVGGVAVTPQTCDDVKISICGVTKSYLDNEITYNSTSNVWEYPLTEAMTKNKAFYLTEYQVAIKVGSDYVYSQVGNLPVNNSIISEEW